MQHWNSFSTLYTPFQSYFLPVNHILLVRVGKSGQYWWVIVYNSLRTHDLHQYKSFFIRGFLKLDPNHRVPFERSLMEVPKEVNMWNPAVTVLTEACMEHRSACEEWRIYLALQRLKLQLGRLTLFCIITSGYKCGQSDMKTDIRRSWKSELSCIEVREITLNTPVFELQTIMWRRLQAYIYKL